MNGKAQSRAHRHGIEGRAGFQSTTPFADGEMTRVLKTAELTLSRVPESPVRVRIDRHTRASAKTKPPADPELGKGYRRAWVSRAYPPGAIVQGPR